MEKNIFGYVLLVGLVLGLIFIGGKVYKEKIRAEVRSEFSRTYVPGPYQPGFDPDKIPSPVPPNRAIYDDLGSPQNWNQVWESQRF